MSLDDIIDRVKWEILRAQALYPRFQSYHQAYAVILEELDELWQEIKQKDKNDVHIVTEAIHVAAMAIRFLYDLEEGSVRFE